MKLIKMLEGKKTYISAVLLALFGLLKAFGITNFTPEQEASVFALLGALMAMSLRASIK